MAGQQQFLDVIDRDEAQRRFHAALRLEPVGTESIPLADALHRVLAENVHALIDVPSFDRSNFDGFAVRAADTYGASEESPRRLELLPGAIGTGVHPQTSLGPQQALAIATGGMLPRGADAIVMVEHTDQLEGKLIVQKASTPGFGITFAGTDIAAGETVLRRSDVLTSRETGVLAAIGVAEVTVFKQPRVAVISTGDEIVAPGEPMRPGLVYDSNARILADAVRELGGVPLPLGIVRDSLDELRAVLREALQEADAVLLSGGTSKGEGDLSYRAVGELGDPGIVAHGVALKPGKPICLAASGGRPVVILPGFPTSAVFTFHEFVAPVIGILAGRRQTPRQQVRASLTVRVNSQIGRTEYLLVSLVEGAEGLAAFPLGKGSGSVTTFSHADGFVTIGRHEEIVPAGSEVDVTLIARDHRLADLVVIGSHCIGVDMLLSVLGQRGWHTQFLAVGSTAGLQAAQRGQCDIAGVHLLDEQSGQYNRPFMTPELRLIKGYTRQQGVLFRRDDARLADCTVEEIVSRATQDGELVMVNRNQGSGTRILIDRLLAGAHPPGYAVAAKSHNAVAAAIVQGRADWGVAIETVARSSDLAFVPLAEEEFDFAVPKSRYDRPAVQAFCQLLEEPAIRERLVELGFEPQRVSYSN